jgi:hypothetical protein
MNCKSIIPFDIFIDKFTSKWVFDKYKKHRYDILWNREQNLLPKTMIYASNKREKQKLTIKKNLLIDEIEIIDKEICELDNSNNIKRSKYGFGQKMDNIFYESTQKRKNLVIKKKSLLEEVKIIIEQIYILTSDKSFAISQYTDRCPMQNCKGYLNNDYLCEICDTTICKNCYCKINNNDHQCDPEMVETFKTIKKEAKPCPRCGEFISKIGGCDQMFCNNSGCGTAFSWKTGLIELGVIHNPHAYAFFQNNAEAYNNYLNIVNNNECRQNIQNLNLFDIFSNTNLINKIDIQSIKKYYRKISQFRFRNHNRYLTYLQNNNDINLDLRIKFINNEITDKILKETLHSRDKKNYFFKQIIQNILSTYEIAQLVIMSILNSMPSCISENNLIESASIEKINKNILLLKELLSDTNKNIQKICDEFKYKNKYIIGEDFHIDSIKIRTHNYGI